MSDDTTVARTNAPTNTAIHQALGETGPLTFEMVERAVEAALAEDETLDWKATEYQTTDRKEAGDEFSKDAAAFANSRGGILVLGVTEDRATGRAEQLRPFPVTDSLIRKMRTWLYPRLAPTLNNVGFHPLLPAGGGTDGVLVVEVPPSPEMPHLLTKQYTLSVPYRDGAQTAWMREFDLERAYRDRFQRQTDEATALARLIADAADFLDTDTQRWLVAAARPTVPMPTNSAVWKVDDVRRIMRSVEERHEAIRLNDNRCPKAFSSLDQHVTNPRVGLRRWVMTNTAIYGDPSARAEAVHIEIHHDGSVVMAVVANPWDEGGLDSKDTLSDASIAGLSVSLSSLVTSVRRERSPRSDSATRLEMVGGKHETVGLVVPPQRQYARAGAEQPGWSRDIRRFHPVETVLPFADRDEQIREHALLMATDVAAQFGVRPVDAGWSEVSQ